MQEFSYMSVEVMSPSISDHSPVVVKLNEGMNTSPKPFKFRLLDDAQQVHGDFGGKLGNGGV